MIFFWTPAAKMDWLIAAATVRAQTWWWWWWFTYPTRLQYIHLLDKREIFRVSPIPLRCEKIFVFFCRCLWVFLDSSNSSIQSNQNATDQQKKMSSQDRYDHSYKQITLELQFSTKVVFDNFQKKTKTKMNTQFLKRTTLDLCCAVL